MNLGNEATKHMQTLISDLDPMTRHIEEFSNHFTKTELAIIRKKENYNEKLIDKIIHQINMLTSFLFRDRPEIKFPNHPKEYVNTFLFRFALIFFVFILEFLSKGGCANVKIEKMRNHIVDLGFACYSTFFDGLLTHDKKLQTIVDEVNFLMRSIVYIKRYA